MKLFSNVCVQKKKTKNNFPGIRLMNLYRKDEWIDRKHWQKKKKKEEDTISNE